MNLPHEVRFEDNYIDGLSAPLHANCGGFSTGSVDGLFITNNVVLADAGQARGMQLNAETAPSQINSVTNAVIVNNYISAHRGIEIGAATSRDLLVRHNTIVSVAPIVVEHLTGSLRVTDNTFFYDGTGAVLGMGGVKSAIGPGPISFDANAVVTAGRGFKFIDWSQAPLPGTWGTRAVKMFNNVTEPAYLNNSPMLGGHASIGSIPAAGPGMSSTPVTVSMPGTLPGDEVTFLPTRNLPQNVYLRGRITAPGTLTYWVQNESKSGYDGSGNFLRIFVNRSF
jgi:hypothetical protein